MLINLNVYALYQSHISACSFYHHSRTILSTRLEGFMRVMTIGTLCVVTLLLTGCVGIPDTDGFFGIPGI